MECVNGSARISLKILCHEMRAGRLLSAVREHFKCCLLLRAREVGPEAGNGQRTQQRAKKKRKLPEGVILRAVFYGNGWGMRQRQC